SPSAWASTKSPRMPRQLAEYQNRAGWPVTTCSSGSRSDKKPTAVERSIAQSAHAYRDFIAASGFHTESTGCLSGTGSVARDDLLVRVAQRQEAHSGRTFNSASQLTHII